MNKKGNDFRKRLFATFKVEAEEHLKTISSSLLELEKAPAAGRMTEIIEVIFREVHSLKGAARSVNLTDIEAVCQSMEGVLASLKRNEIAPAPELFDLLHQAVNGLERLLSSLPVPARPAGGRQTGLEAEAKRMESQKPLLTETVRIATAKLDSILFQAEELLTEKMAANQCAAELRGINEMLAGWKKRWAKIHPIVRAIQQSFERNDRRKGLGKRNSPIMKLLEFLDWSNTGVKSLEGKLSTLSKSAEQDHRSLGGKVDHLLDDIKKVLMLPFASLLEVFPKLVRDLSRDRGKEVEWVVQGSEIEMDRRILEEMKDPLIHLVRNCMDHGIEAPAERERKQKPRRGKIHVSISQKDAGKVEIAISDDGAGIDAARVRSAALKLGVITPEQAEKLGEKEALSLIFLSGVSTSPIITDLSGRGLGLAIVQEKVEKLGGIISLETHPDIGTTFRTVLPLTLATFRGILVRVDEHFLVLPTTHAERMLRVNKAEIKTVENRETIELDGQPVLLVRLEDVLELPRRVISIGSEDSVPVAVLDSAERRIAFQVDEILHEQEVLVKSLGRQLARVRNIAGATVLGTGRVVPILNVPDLMKSAVKVAATPARTPARPAGQEAPPSGGPGE